MSSLSPQSATAVPGARAPLSGFGGSAASRRNFNRSTINKPSTQMLRNGVGLAAIFGLGYALRDGLKDGFRRIGDFSNSISNVISVPFSLLFPYFMLRNERANLSDSGRSKDDLLNRMVYTAASLGFASNTWGDPLKMATRSTPHMVATMMNLPHILFSFFSYTGGRFMSFITAIKKNKDPNNYRLEQEFEALYRLGNLGSAQCSVIPMSGQFILGWETITDIFKGNFGSVWERFKKEPVSVGLGTIFNSWAWPFEYVGKFLDTTIRTAEQVDSFQNAFQGSNKDGKDTSYLVKGLKALRNKWHKASQDPNNPMGVALKHGRQLSKIGALLLPPGGMVSVVAPPALNKFLRGEFFNREAQEIGGTIGFVDKVFNIGAFFTHMYYTLTYSFSVRLPQMVTTGTFYISQVLNHLRGKKPGDNGYLEPTIIRDKIFNRNNGIIKGISDWAEKKLNQLEKELHPGEEILITKESQKCRYIRGFHQVLAEEVCYTPVREKYYSIEAASLNNRKPSNRDWGIALRDKYSEDIKKDARKALEDYLRESVLLDENQIHDFMYGKYKYEAEIILKEVDKLLQNEINHCTSDNSKSKPAKEPEIKSKSLFEALGNWGELKKILLLKTFHVTNTILPLWIRGFVNVADYGKPDDPFWLRNLKIQETGIREGDVKQACDREFMQVVGYAFQSMGKGLALLWNLLHGRMPQPSEE